MHIEYSYHDSSSNEIETKEIISKVIKYPVNTISVLHNRNSQSFETVLPIHDDIREIYCFDLVGNTYQLQCQEKSLDGFCQLSMPMQKQIVPGLYGIRIVLNKGAVYTGTSIVF